MSDRWYGSLDAHLTRAPDDEPERCTGCGQFIGLRGCGCDDDGDDEPESDPRFWPEADQDDHDKEQ